MQVTVGNLFDRLSVVNIRIWMAEDVKRGENATPEQIVKATKTTNVANQERNDLIQAIDETISGMIDGTIKIKNYKQGSTKMYGK